MKSFVALLAVVSVVAADVSHLFKQPERNGNEDQAVILKQNADVLPDGYTFEVETSNGILAQESGRLVNVGTPDEALSVQGQNSYTNPDGVRIETTYVADANGYQAQGAHLPTTPAPQPIPEYIARAIAYIQAHPPKEELRRV